MMPCTSRSNISRLRAIGLPVLHKGQNTVYWIYVDPIGQCRFNLSNRQASRIFSRTPAALILCTTEKLQLQEMRDPVIVRLAEKDNISVFHCLDNSSQAGLAACNGITNLSFHTGTLSLFAGNSCRMHIPDWIFTFARVCCVWLLPVRNLMLWSFHLILNFVSSSSRRQRLIERCMRVARVQG